MAEVLIAVACLTVGYAAGHIRLLGRYDEWLLAWADKDPRGLRAIPIGALMFVRWPVSMSKAWRLYRASRRPAAVRVNPASDPQARP